MRATILFAPLLAVLSAVAAPAPEAGLSVREGEPDILRIGFTEHYCVLPAGTERGLGCPADQQQQVGSTDGSDWTATIEGHEVSIVHLSCTGYTCEDVVSSLKTSHVLHPS